MPRYMDVHENLTLPPEMINQLAEETKSHQTDDFGVSQVELYYNADGKVYCLLEGPDENAVRAHHEALGVPCGPVDRVDSLL